MIPTPPPGQGPIDPRGAFVPPPPPGMGAAQAPPVGGGGQGGQGGPMPTWPMPYPPRRRGGPWRWILIAVLLVLLIGSLITNAILTGALMTSGGSVNQTVLT